MITARKVTAPDGSIRWIGADGRSFESKEAAEASEPKEPKNAGCEAAALRLFHLKGDGSELWQGLSASKWIVATTPKRALEICIQNLALPVTKHADGKIRVYAYERPSEGVISLEDQQYCVATFSNGDVNQIVNECL